MEEEKFSDLINNFKKILDTNNQNSEKSSDNFQKSNLNITPEMISNLTAVFEKSKRPSQNNNQTINNDNFTSNIDMDTILKLKTIIEKMNNKDDPRTNLLYSLKPYLRKSRKDKLDQYINLLKLTTISEILQNGKWRKN